MGKRRSRKGRWKVNEGGRMNKGKKRVKGGGRGGKEEEKREGAARKAERMKTSERRSWRRLDRTKQENGMYGNTSRPVPSAGIFSSIFDR